MLIKEYRIPLPMTVEEYRIAQLYMIAKKSREESKGAESGVEILINEPYEDGPGGKGGQYTHKIYHVGSHLPAWLKSLMPKTALIVEEEAWNAYPYTKTRFKCPFVDKFSLECETYYTPDGGSQENIFQLPDSEKRNRIVDLIDIVKDNEGVVYEDPEKEDPTIYSSSKTGRGPLNENWIEDYSADCEGQKQPTKNGCAIMCAYKLCKVEFRYWGMQSKIERFIHDVALRKTMLKGHLQAWTWQDEWDGLTMEDIRAIERKTAADLKHDAENHLSDVDTANKSPAEIKDVSDSVQASSKSSENKCHQEARETFNSIEYSEAEIPNIIPKPSDRLPRKSSVGIGLGTSAAMKRSRSGGLNNEKSSLDQFEGTQKCIC